MVINTSLFFGVVVVARAFFLFGSKCDLRSASFFFINALRLPKEAVGFVLLARLATPTVCVRLELGMDRMATVSELLLEVEASEFTSFFFPQPGQKTKDVSIGHPQKQQNILNQIRAYKCKFMLYKYKPSNCEKFESTWK